MSQLVFLASLAWRNRLFLPLHPRISSDPCLFSYSFAEYLSSLLFLSYQLLCQQHLFEFQCQIRTFSSAEVFLRVHHRCWTVERVSLLLSVSSLPLLHLYSLQILLLSVIISEKIGYLFVLEKKPWFPFCWSLSSFS